MRSKLLACAVGAALLLQGCSSRPREFVPTLAVPAADQKAFDATYAECQQLLVQGKLDSSGRLASAATGAAALAAAGTVGGATAASAGLYAGAAIASATLVALPLVALGGAWGMAKSKQKRKEAAIQRVMTGCLKDRGYEVTDWQRWRGRAAAPAATPPAE